MKSDGRPIRCLLALTLATLLLGGCPVAMDCTLTGATPAVTAGTYWVADSDGALLYYELPAMRGAAGRWVDLAPADQSWYAGPGWYTTSGYDDWTGAADMGSITLDDVVTLHDPPPAPDMAD